MTDINRIYGKGIRQVSLIYRLAIAAQVRGEPEEAEEAWERYAEALAWVLTLSAMTGQALAYQSVPKQGQDWDVSDWPDKKPEKFANNYAFKAGTWWKAILGLRRRVPKSYAEVKRIRKQMQRLAKRIATAESVTALKDLTKRLEGLQKALDGSFTVKGASQAQAKRIKELIAQSIEKKAVVKGLKTASLSSFIRRAQVEGIVGMTAARMETVYRTNVASVYNNATADTMSGPAVAKWAPLLKLVEIHDPRTRGAPGGVYSGKKAANPGKHWQMDGYIATAEDFKRQGLVPPNGFNCRGSLVPVTRSQAERMGLVQKDGSLDRDAINRYNATRQRIIDRGEYPDPGFKR